MGIGCFGDFSLSADCVLTEVGGQKPDNFLTARAQTVLCCLGCQSIFSESYDSSFALWPSWTLVTSDNTVHKQGAWLDGEPGLLCFCNFSYKYDIQTVLGN